MCCGIPRGKSASSQIADLERVVESIHDDYSVFFAEDLVVAYTVSPQSEFAASEWFAKLPWILRRRESSFQVVSTISRWTWRSSDLRSLSACGSYSIVQAKFFSHLGGGEWSLVLAEAYFGDIAILKIFETRLNQFARTIRLSTATFSDRRCEVALVQARARYPRLARLRNQCHQHT